jgi:serine protease Do
LLNVDGKVVGITAAIVENSQGVGFAIPSNTIIREISWLISTGSYDLHSYLGVTGQDMDYFTAVDHNTNVTYGWLIGSIVSGGPAESKDVHVNDIIVGINQTSVISGDGMSSYLEEQTVPGDTVILHLIRDNQPLDRSLVLDNRPPPPA